MNRIIILALDGFSWNIIKDLIKLGRLKNIKNIIKYGSYGILYADEPLLSPQIWASISTGKKQESHGIKDFYSTKYDLKFNQIWDTLINNNIKIGIYKFMTALDLIKKDYFFIPSSYSFEKEAYPQELSFIQNLSQKARMNTLDLIFIINTIKRLLKYRFPLKVFLILLKEFLCLKFNKQHSYRFYKLKYIEFLINSNLYFNLVKLYSPEFTIFYENIIDTLSHLFWRDYKKNTKSNKFLIEIYMKIDKFIKKINNYALKNKYHLLIISDHGFKEVPIIYPQDKIKTINILNLLKELNLEEEVYGTLLGLNAFFRLKPRSSLNFNELKNIFENITCNDENLFIINEFEDNLIVKLKWFISKHKNSMIKLYNGKLINANSIINFDSRITGYHDAENGFFLIKGPNIKEGINLGKIRPYDINPTILSLLGVSIPKDVDGIILKDLFIKTHKIDYSFEEKRLKKDEKKLTVEEEEIIKKRLKLLGYL